MIRLISISIDAISFAVTFLPVMLLFHFTVVKKHNYKKMVSISLFAIYISAVFSAVGIPDVNSLTIDPSFNLLPVMDIVSNPAGYIKNTILNILLFVPLGFLLPFIWKEYHSLKKILFIGLGLSFIIEILQLFTYRLTDIDDLFTNTAGTVTGYFIWEKLQRKLSVSNESTFCRYEPFIIITVSFLIMFLVQPYIVRAVWEYVLESPLWAYLR